MLPATSCTSVCELTASDSYLAFLAGVHEQACDWVEESSFDLDICSDDSEDDIAGDADESFHGFEMNDIESDDVVVWEGSFFSFVEEQPSAQVADNKHGRLLAAIRLNPDLSTDSDGDFDYDFDSDNEGSLEIEEFDEEKAKRRERRNGMFLPWGLI
ncbi:hypothetical protein V5O48_013326 [Marasmius crinis-equi]|uniref:Uncharacterized protein n=1 Tax=Marasmius crinis-equi TaxID=585013 RepID=A0ABR3F0F2_9AGAR